MKYAIYAIVAVIIVLFPWTHKLIPQSTLSGTISSLSAVTEDSIPHRTANIRLSNKNIDAYVYESNIQYNVGDEVMIQEDAQFENMYTVTDHSRTNQLFRLFLLFIIIILVVSGTAGFRSLLGLTFSFSVIFKFVLPQIIAGSNPLTVALLASIAILFVSYYLSHGINDKTSIAILGTFGALAITGTLAMIYSASSKLSGFGTEEASFLTNSIPLRSFYDLYLAGIVIGSLGVLDDITISQASIVSELAKANDRLGMSQLYRRAMNIGHDHISSLVNTLVLVYAGSALPLLLLFVASQSSPLELLNYEMMAEEIVRTLVGSIGLVAAVPLTTVIAAYWYKSKR